MNMNQMQKRGGGRGQKYQKLCVCHLSTAPYSEYPFPQEMGRPVSCGKGDSLESSFPEGKILSRNFCFIKREYPFPEGLRIPFPGRGIFMKQPPYLEKLTQP